MLHRSLLKTVSLQINKIFKRNLCNNMTNESHIAAVCQMTATNDKNRNYDIIEKLVSKAKDKNALMVFLPEGCDYIARDVQECVALAEDVSGPLMQNYCCLAKKYDIWISIGGFHERVDVLQKRSQVYNTHFIIDNKGEIKATYRKIHLFDVDLPEKNLHLHESKSVTSGSNIAYPIDTPVGKIGLAICYDLRFPEMSTLLRKFGATVLTYPSAFTLATGVLHWETLLRARAIENQCYVLAPAQVGEHNSKRVSYGCSMIIDPMGNVLGKCRENDGTERQPEPEIIYADLNDSQIVDVRANMPVFQHRRSDIYSLSENTNFTSLQISRNFQFSVNEIPGNTVFYESAHSFAFTNIRCVVPGHVLVATKRIALRLVDLQVHEIADLFQTVVKVQKVVEKSYASFSSTIVVQDGKDAGQTVKHVHVHILPRKEGDFNRNDDIYDSLARHDKPESEMKRRNEKEMITEALMLKSMFSNNK